MPRGGVRVHAGRDRPAIGDPPHARDRVGRELLVVAQPELDAAVQHRDEDREHGEDRQRGGVQPRREERHVSLRIHLHEVDDRRGDEGREPEARGELDAHPRPPEQRREPVRLREAPRDAREHQCDADLHTREQEGVVAGVRVAHGADVTADVDAVREAAAGELGDERQEGERGAGEPALPVHGGSLPNRAGSRTSRFCARRRARRA